MSTDEENKDDDEEIEVIKDSTIIHLAKRQRWDHLITILRERYDISNEFDAIICYTLIEKLLSSFDAKQINDFQQFKQAFDYYFNNTFDELSQNELDSLYQILMDENSDNKYSKYNHNKLLNHEKLPITLLTVYYYKTHHFNKDNSNNANILKGVLEQIFDENNDINISKETLNQILDGFEQQQHPSTTQELLVRVKPKSNNTDNAEEEENKVDHDNDINKPFIFGIAKKYPPGITYQDVENKSDDEPENFFDKKQFDEKQFDEKQFDELLSKGYIELENGAKVYVRSNAWLSCDLRLDEIKNKEQYFTISGWINVIWKEPKYSLLYKAIMECYREEINSKNIWQYRDGGSVCMRILDLREADKISYYLPIDARKIFEQTTIKNVEYRDQPHLIFNKDTGVIRTEYNITASLSEHFELFWFPFDKQFLNIKIRWNVDWYHILHWIEGKDEETHIPKIPDISKNERDVELLYKNPLKVNIVEELQDDIILHEPWIGTKNTMTVRTAATRFGLIRLRFTRSPMYHVIYILFPLFIIVVCGFSVYAIPSEDIADRLGVSFTVLLTFTAFQSIVSDNLPSTAELEFLDYYIVIAYLLQGLVIFSTIYPYFNNEQYDTESNPDKMFAIILFVSWMIVSTFYIFGGMLIWSIYKCCGKKTEEFKLCDKLFWEKRGKNEIEHWSATREMKHNFVMRLDNKDNESVMDALLLCCKCQKQKLIYTHSFEQTDDESDDESDHD